MRKLLAALLLLLAGVTPAFGETVLRARLNADIIGSDPRGNRDLNTDAVLLHVTEGLVASREDGSIGPMLAQRWQVSPDGRTYRFALRPGIVFHNGARLTAADVQWSLNRYLAAGSHWRCKADLTGGIAKIVGIAAPDPLTAVITLDRPAPLFLMTLARADCGGTGILQRASVDGAGRWIAPIGTGPFRWGEWRRNQFIDLLRFTDYRPLPGPRDGNGGGKHVLVDRARFQIIPDDSAASAALVRGSIDLLDGLSTNALAGLQGTPGIRMTSARLMDWFGVLFHARSGPLADPRLRKAIALTIDLGPLVRVATHGTGVPHSSPIPVVSPYYGAAQRPIITANLARARALAAAAGYNGQPIQLFTSRSPPETFDVAILVQAMARRAGINLEVVLLDWASQLARYEQGNYDAMVFSFSARLDPSLSYSTLIGDPVTDTRKAWTTPEARALLKQSIETGDKAERQQIFDTLEAQFRRETPAITLYNARRVTVMRSTVYGYQSWPAQLQRLWGVGKRGA